MATSPRRVLCVLGTRPEVIKFAPLVRELDARRPLFEVGVCSTGQHEELFETAAECFGLRTDWRLGLMEPGQRPDEFLARALGSLAPVIREFAPDVVLVQGDTTSTFAGALAAYYAGVPIGHVEAGLRSGDPQAPFPEEQHRRMVDQLARWHFAPTARARQNLLSEGLAPEQVYVTGNTGVDSLRWLERRVTSPERVAAVDAYLREQGLEPAGYDASGRRALVLVTVHRREHGPEAIEGICEALRTLAASSNVDLLMPMHPNPRVHEALQRRLQGSTVRLVAPLGPERFVGLMHRAKLVITDSGGVQEEAATLGVPALIVRTRNDRPESVTEGGSRVVGHRAEAIIAAASRVLDQPSQPRQSREPFGDGQAALRIADILAL
jgi:UDP-N-acetylglucosamine 2-epimerase